MYTKATPSTRKEPAEYTCKSSKPSTTEWVCSPYARECGYHVRQGNRNRWWLAPLYLPGVGQPGGVCLRGGGWYNRICLWNGWNNRLGIPVVQRTNDSLKLSGQPLPLRGSVVLLCIWQLPASKGYGMVYVSFTKLRKHCAKCNGWSINVNMKVLTPIWEYENGRSHQLFLQSIKRGSLMSIQTGSLFWVASPSTR